MNVSIEGAALLAYLVGKISYQGTCREKILRLQNSPLAEAMRKGKRGTGLLQDMSAPLIAPVLHCSTDSFYLFQIICRE